MPTLHLAWPLVSGSPCRLLPLVMLPLLRLPLLGSLLRLLAPLLLRLQHRLIWLLVVWQSVRTRLAGHSRGPRSSGATITILVK
jgi:hypothetical protein